MNIIRLAGELFLIYILYQLIFNFIIPLYQTAKKVKKQFGEMQNKMHGQMNSDSYGDDMRQNTQPTYGKHQTVRKEDYIDYEEVK